MGVHWPTDIFAGWAAGAVWALLCWLIAERLQRKGHVEDVITENDSGVYNDETS
jgi:undecaprenyl-diphosphatase